MEVQPIQRALGVNAGNVRGKMATVFARNRSTKSDRVARLVIFLGYDMIEPQSRAEIHHSIGRQRVRSVSLYMGSCFCEA